MVNSDRWEANKTLQASPEGPGRNLFRWKGLDIEVIKTHHIRFTREGSKKSSSGCQLSIFFFFQTREVD